MTDAQINAMSFEQMKARLAELEAEKIERENSKYNLTFKVGNKGTVSVYGLGKFPVSLYVPQWNALFKNVARLGKFIGENSELIADRVANPIIVPDKV